MTDDEIKRIREIWREERKKEARGEHMAEKQIMGLTVNTKMTFTLKELIAWVVAIAVIVGGGMTYKGLLEETAKNVNRLSVVVDKLLDRQTANEQQDYGQDWQLKQVQRELDDLKAKMKP